MAGEIEPGQRRDQLAAVLFEPGRAQIVDVGLDCFDRRIEVDLLELDLVEFEAQDLRENDPYFSRRYHNILRRIPDFELRAAQLSQEDIEDMYKCADVLLLPYDGATYAPRGSAVYQEALAYGRLAVATRGTGVGSLIERYGNGAVATSDAEFADSLVSLCQMGVTEARSVVDKARKANEEDFQRGMESLVGPRDA